MTRQKEKEFIEMRIANLEKAIKDYPDSAGNEYFSGKIQAYKDILELFSGTFDTWETRNKVFVACKETGDFITEVSSVQEGIELIKEYEKQDKSENIFAPDFYDVVNNDHVSML